MVVYEAITKQHFQKIVAWLASQPSESFSLTCWGRLADVAKEQAYSIKVLSYWKEKYPSLSIFVCEDSKKQIKAVLVRIIKARPAWDFPKPIMHIVTAFLDHDSYMTENLVYSKEILTYAIKRDYEAFGISKVQGYVDDKFLKILTKVFGAKNIVIENESDNVYYGRMRLISMHWV